MKLLIIAGPYEADRIRRAAVLAGFEAVAVEPGESLSGWITATRADVIVLAPQIVSPDLNKALGKVRAVPRGRVPIFLVGDEEDRAGFQDQADGFFVRPVAPEELFARARDAVARATDDPASGPHASPGSGSHAKVTDATADDSGRMRAFPAAEGTPTRTPTLKPLVPAVRDAAGSGAVPRDSTEVSTRAGIPLPRQVPSPRKTAESWPPVPRDRDPMLFAAMSEEIEAEFEAELRDAVRAVGALRAEQPAVATAAAEAETAEAEIAELKDESSQKTLEVPSRVSVALLAEGTRPERDPQAERAAVLALYARVMDCDYFQILGVGRDATASEIQTAHDRLLAELTPEALAPVVAAELEVQLIEIRAVVTEAARLLLNETVRGRYQRHLPSLDVPA